MENQNAIPLSKRALTASGTSLLIAQVSNSESKHAAMAMVIIAVVAVCYMIADGIKEWKRHAKSD